MAGEKLSDRFYLTSLDGISLVNDDGTKTPISEFQVSPDEEEIAGRTASMDDLLVPMVGRCLPSSKDRVIYEVVAVVPGQHVTLRSSTRKANSVLPWHEIERVYDAGRSGTNIT